MVKLNVTTIISDVAAAFINVVITIFLNILLWLSLGSSQYLLTIFTGIIIYIILFLIYIKLSFRFSKLRRVVGGKSIIYSAIIFLIIIILLCNPLVINKIAGAPWGGY